MSRKYAIALAVISLAILLVFVGSATFAYFASTYTQSGNDQVINVTTKTVASVVYTSGNSVNYLNVDLPKGDVIPENVILGSNEFNMAVKGDSVTGGSITFGIKLINLVTDFVITQNARDVGTSDIVCDVYESDAQGVKGTKIAEAVNCLTPDTPEGNVITLVSSKTITAGINATVKKYYTIDFILYNAPVADNTNEGKGYNATVSISGIE